MQRNPFGALNRAACAVPWIDACAAARRREADLGNHLPIDLCCLRTCRPSHEPPDFIPLSLVASEYGHSQALAETLSANSIAKFP
eukprot:scaffold25721_cov63-Phaeocystis_antarctica.AAC.6